MKKDKKVIIIAIVLILVIIIGFIIYKKSNNFITPFTSDVSQVYFTITKEYNTKVFEGMFEITSLVGNVTRKDCEVYLHIHINFGDEEGLVKGGHLVKSKISATSARYIS